MGSHPGHSSNTWPRCGALLLRNRSSWLTRSVPQNVASITAGMFHQILLVVFLRRIEFRCRRNFRRDWPIEFAGFVPPSLHAFGDLFLLFAGVENRRAILRAHVVVLPVQRGGIVHPKEIIQQGLVTEPGGIEFHLNRLGMASAAS